MDYLQKFIQQFRARIFLLLIISDLIIVANWWVVDKVLKLTDFWFALGLIAVPVLSLVLLPMLSVKYLTRPTKLIWQAILHITPHASEQVPAPQLESLKFGKDLVTTLTSQLYQFATVADTVSSKLEKKGEDLANNPVASNLPLPLLVLDKEQNIIYANAAAQTYLGISAADLIGKNMYNLLDMSFKTKDTYDTWLNNARANTVTDSHAWSHIKLSVPDTKKTLLLDLAACYSKASPVGFETCLIMFDHTKQYGQEEDSASFVTMAVHELRTPLTLLRGYIEALEEDLDGKLPDNDVDFLHRMDAAGQQLAAFVNNILNVARVEDDQFMIQLHEEKWPDIVAAVVNDMRLRAGTKGIEIETSIAPDLPTVGVDKISIYEVLANLLDNAIKYSVDSKKIIVKSYQTQDGLVETTVQDFGVGIPESVVPNLFDKFYRNHRTRVQISGTGLGLYLSKAIVTAHSGNIWVRSKEGEGSIFGFTILPYAKLSAASKGQTDDFTRTAHGWIKNHSLYRR